MKKSVITTIASMVVSVASFAQAQPIPVDPSVHMGRLDNGMTYYIRPNAETTGKANFCIAQRDNVETENNTYVINNASVAATDSSLAVLHNWAQSQIASLPSQQAIVVAGDVDAETVENKIQEIFASIPAKKAPKTFEEQVAEAFIPVVHMAKDENRTDAITYIYCKHDIFPRENRNDISYLFHEFKLQAVVKMMNARLQQMQETAQVPFTSAQVTDGEFFFDKSKHSLTGQAISSEANVDETVAGLYREMLRAVRKGFTAAEFDQARTEILREYQNAVFAGQKSNNDYAQDCLNHFLEGEPLANAETDYNLMQGVSNHVTVKDVNLALREMAGNNNLVVFSVLPDNDNLNTPTEFDIHNLLAQVVRE